MQKLAQILIFLCALYFVLPGGVRAQDFTFQKSYEDYQFSLETYNNTFSAYENGKAAYLKNPTLTLKEDARKATLAMLKSRDELQRVYLTAIRMKILENRGLTDDEKKTLFGKIDPEAEWYSNHKNQYTDGDTLESLFVKSAEAEERNKKATSPIVYESLFYISLGEVTNLRIRQENAYSALTDIINEGVSAGRLDINPFNRWFLDIEEVTKKLKSNEDAGRTAIQKMYGRTYINPLSTYTASIRPLEESIKYLSQFNGYLREMASSVKNQQNGQ